MFVKSPLKFDPTKNPLTRPKIEKPQKKSKMLDHSVSGEGGLRTRK